jgi:hypothetical protein
MHAERRRAFVDVAEKPVNFNAMTNGNAVSLFGGGANFIDVRREWL